MWGFGSPHAFGLPDTPTTTGTPGAQGVFPVDTPDYDWGFGDPLPNNFSSSPSEEWGFGEPDPPKFTAFMASGSVVADDGGEIVRLVGEWPIVGPYRVQLVHATTAEVFPDTGKAWGTTAVIRTDSFMRVKTRTQPYFNYTNYSQKKDGDTTLLVPGKYLSMTLPQVPPGIYDVRIRWGQDALADAEFAEDPLVPSELAKFGQHWAAAMVEEVVIPKALHVVYRNRDLATWHVRSSFPPVFDPGPRTIRLENPFGTLEDDYDG